MFLFFSGFSVFRVFGGAFRVLSGFWVFWGSLGFLWVACWFFWGFGGSGRLRNQDLSAFRV